MDRALSLLPVNQQHYGSGQHYSTPMSLSSPPLYNENTAPHPSESSAINDQQPQQTAKEQGDHQVTCSGQPRTTGGTGKTEASNEVIAAAPVTFATASDSEKTHSDSKDFVEVTPQDSSPSGQNPASVESAGAAGGAVNDSTASSATPFREPKSQEPGTEAQGNEETIAGAWIPWIQDPVSEEFLEGGSGEVGDVPVSPSNVLTTGEAVSKDPEAKSAADEIDGIWGWVSSPKNSP